jgi:hypothetical protein
MSEQFTPPDKPGQLWLNVAGVCPFLALGFAGYGFLIVFEIKEIVGGDAFNYEIAALRGLAWIAGGIVWAGVGAVLALFGVAARMGGKE